MSASFEEIVATSKYWEDSIMSVEWNRVRDELDAWEDEELDRVIRLIAERIRIRKVHKRIGS